MRISTIYCLRLSQEALGSSTYVTTFRAMHCFSLFHYQAYRGIRDSNSWSTVGLACFNLSAPLVVRKIDRLGEEWCCRGRTAFDAHVRLHR